MGRVLQILLAASVALAVAGCATSGTPASAAMPPERQYAGAGQDPSLIGAMNEAKMDAVRKAVIDLIGAPAEQANRETLAAKLYTTRNPNAYVVPESFETTRKDSDRRGLPRGVPGARAHGSRVRNARRARPAGRPRRRGSSRRGGGGRDGGAAATAAAARPAPTADEEKIIRDLCRAHDVDGLLLREEPAWIPSP